MEVFRRLPKDIQYLINDYLKDPSNYKLVITQFNGLVIASLDWMAKPNLDSVVRFMLVQRKKDIITRNNIWYDECKKLKKQHGKRPPTKKDKRYVPSRCKRGYRIRYGRRNYNPNYLDVLQRAHDWIKRVHVDPLTPCFKYNGMKLL